MKANKTQPTPQSVSSYLDRIGDDNRRGDAIELVKLMQEVTKTEPVMWGSSIIGFGTYHYVYETGREGDTAAVGFAARKQALVLYGLFHFEQNEENIALAQQLGTHTHGKGCLYIKNLSDINEEIIKQMIKNAYKNRMNV